MEVNEKQPTVYAYKPGWIAFSFDETTRLCEVEYAKRILAELNSALWHEKQMHDREEDGQ